ncbi:MAG: hypothetical protein Q8Q67_01880 [bacterium]|nr:hypothetical protein [bacterium]
MNKFEKSLVQEGVKEDSAVKNETTKFKDKINQLFSFFHSLDKEAEVIEKQATHLSQEEIAEIKDDIDFENELENVNEEAAELFVGAEEKLNKTEALIVEMLEIINLGDTGDQVEAFTELYEAVRSAHAQEAPKIKEPLEVLEEMKKVLFSRLYQLTTEARMDKAPKNIDREQVRRAQIALLHAGDDFDFKKWSSSNIGSLNFGDLHRYLFRNGEGFSEEEIDVILSTNLRSQFLNDDFGRLRISKQSIEGVPDSLLIALTGKGDYYAIADALEKGPAGKYSVETLKHLIACDRSDLCLKHYDKFDGGLELILKSGRCDALAALRLVINSDLSQGVKDIYIDVIRKNSHKTYGFAEGLAKFYDDKQNVVSYPEDEAAIHKLVELTYKQDEYSNYVRELYSSGRTALVLGIYGAREELAKIAAEDYDFFITQAKNNSQEHLIIDLMKEPDAREYAQKLIAKGDGYLVSAYLDKFPSNSLKAPEFKNILNRDNLPYLEKKVEAFSGLDDDIAANLINRGDYSFIFKNAKQFSLSAEFVRKPEVQAAAIEEIKDGITGYQDGKYAASILKTIPIAPAVIDNILMDAVTKKMFDHDRLDWACNFLMTFPHLKQQLAEKHLETAREGFLKAVQGDYLFVIADIIEAFPLSDSFLNTKEVKDAIIKISKAELNSAAHNDDYYIALMQVYDRINKIAQRIEVPAYLLDRTAVEKAAALPTETINLRKEFVVKVAKSENAAELLERLVSVSNEAIKRTDIALDKNIVLAYTDKFLNGGTSEEKEEFIEVIKQDITTVAQNIPANFNDRQEYYRYILEQVYPSRNHNSYESLDKYIDRSTDLDRYTFEKKGYEIRLSGVLGYKLKTGTQANEALLAEFSKRIEEVKDLAEAGKLHGFLDANINNSKARTLEGKILDYFKTNGYSVDTMNVLLAYQLLGSFDDFYNASADRVSSEEDQVSKNYIMLDELANQYGDNMKETIRSIQGKVANSEDRELFSTSFIDKYEKKYEAALSVIIEDLNKVPKDKIDTALIRKKVEKTIKNIFQGHESIIKRAQDFASLFEGNDWVDFSDVWKQQIDELFAIDKENCIDTQKVQAMQATIYNRLQEEVGKYEDIKEVDSTKNETKLKKNRVITGFFSKNKENAHARMVGDICIGKDPKMLENTNYFEFVLFDQEKKKNVGTTMLLQMDEPDGKYLLYCPNPAVSLVSEVSAKKIYQAITARISHFAEENGFKAVLVDKRHGHSTNRAGLFQQSLEQSCLKDRSGQERKVNLLIIMCLVTLMRIRII